MAGNPNPTGRKADKVVRDALLAALRQDPDKLKKAAEKAWDKAIEGDLMAFREIADRLDGKAVQAIVGDDDYAPVRVLMENDKAALEHYFKTKMGRIDDARPDE